jgi:hypothetical protein
MRALLILALLGVPQETELQPGKTLKAAMQHYRDALARARWSGVPGSLLGVYNQARAFGLDRTPALAEETKAYLTEATPDQRDAFFHDLAGLRFGAPDKVPLPDLAFYKDVARTSKNKESRRFIEFLEGFFSRDFKRPYEDKELPCVKLGHGEAVDAARTLRSAEAHLPHFRSVFTSEREVVIKALLSPCACFGKEESRREIESFLKTFPKDPSTSVLEGQLSKIASGDPGLQFHCKGP